MSFQQAGLLAGWVAAATAVGIYVVQRRSWLAEQEVQQTARKHTEKKWEEERSGRTRAERELRRVVNEGGDLYKGGLQPIGHIESVFVERNGTPRQGVLVPSGRGVLRLTTANAAASLEALDQYSHVWIIFIFHENTNILRGVRQDKKSSLVKSKVSPPRLDGQRVGLFSTRTPHRPNPIGLSVARVDRIEGGAVFLSGIDLVDGTPVLDIKPYIPHYDALPTAVAPAWTSEAPVSPLKEVWWSPEAEQALEALLPKLKFYTKLADIRGAIEQVLRLDIRSVRKRQLDREREAKGAECVRHRFSLDRLNVVFTIANQKGSIFVVEEDKREHLGISTQGGVAEEAEEGDRDVATEAPTEQDN